MSQTHHIFCSPKLFLGQLLLSALAAGCSAGDPAVATQPPASANVSAALVALPAAPVTAATSPAAPARNPFENAEFFVNPDYSAKVKDMALRHPEQAPQLAQLAAQPTAIWLDRIEALEQVPVALEQASEQSATTGKPVVPVFVVYDLPNRDCAAEASAGELSVEDGGEMRYRTEFIDALRDQLAAKSDQRVVLILEPDSLPNLVSNLGVKQCARSQTIYKNSLAYAIAQLSLPHVYLYLDAAHAGWLGWESNRRRTVELFKEVLALAGGADRIRGFATNVSNYNPLTGDDGKSLEATNPCPNELCYVQALADSLEQAGITSKGFIVDTARNGRSGIRTRWGHWCNIRGAGIGERPKAAPTALVDAYYWVKPPGESDGTADPAAPRFDKNCASADAAPGAPQAGQWFESYLVDLVKYASPAL